MAILASFLTALWLAMMTPVAHGYQDPSQYQVNTVTQIPAQNQSFINDFNNIQRQYQIQRQLQMQRDRIERLERLERQDNDWR